MNSHWFEQRVGLEETAEKGFGLEDLSPFRQPFAKSVMPRRFKRLYELVECGRNRAGARGCLHAFPHGCSDFRQFPNPELRKSVPAAKEREVFHETEILIRADRFPKPVSHRTAHALVGLPHTLRCGQICHRYIEPRLLPAPVRRDAQRPVASLVAAVRPRLEPALRREENTDFVANWCHFLMPDKQWRSGLQRDEQVVDDDCALVISQTNAVGLLVPPPWAEDSMRRRCRSDQERSVDCRLKCIVQFLGSEYFILLEAAKCIDGRKPERSMLVAHPAYLRLPHRRTIRLSRGTSRLVLLADRGHVDGPMVHGAISLELQPNRQHSRKHPPRIGKAPSPSPAEHVPTHGGRKEPEKRLIYLFSFNFFTHCPSLPECTSRLVDYDTIGHGRCNHGWAPRLGATEPAVGLRSEPIPCRPGRLGSTCTMPERKREHIASARQAHAAIECTEVEVNTIAMLAGALRAPDRPDRPVPLGIGDAGARFLYGPRDAPSPRIAPDSQPFPFVVGPEEVCRLCTLRTHRQMLEFVGFEWSWVTEKLAAGHRFRLLLFSFRQAKATRATWDNLLGLVADRSPRCAEKLAPHMPDLKATPYLELIERIGYDVDHLSPERQREVSSFAAFADDAVPADLGRARAFFRHALKCTALFRGDGYAYDEHGRRGAREYVMPNTRVEDLPGAARVDLDPS